MKDLTFTKQELIAGLRFDETDYNKAIEGSDGCETFDKFIDNIMDTSRECNATWLDALFLADTSFESLGKKVYDVYFNDDDNSNNKGWHATYGYCKDYIDNYNGTNESYFADYKGGTVSIYNNETEEDVYTETVR